MTVGRLSHPVRRLLGQAPKSFSFQTNVLCRKRPMGSREQFCRANLQLCLLDIFLHQVTAPQIQIVVWECAKQWHFRNLFGGNYAQNIDVSQVEGGFWRCSERDEIKTSKKAMFTGKDAWLNTGKGSQLFWPSNQCAKIFTWPRARRCLPGTSERAGTLGMVDGWEPIWSQH